MTGSTLIRADAFNRSIEAALRNPYDVNGALNRIKRSINSLPEGKLYASHHSREVAFYTIVNGHQKYMAKGSADTHALARKTYLLPLQEILELTGSVKPKDMQRRQALTGKIQKMITAFGCGNLELERIVLTSNQYKWLTGNFIQKKIDKTKALKTSSGIYVRSKSERDIINGIESYAVPIHYEEQLVIYAKPLVDKLRETLMHRGLMQKGYPGAQLYTYNDGIIHWLVPSELAWMNSFGSIWRSYNPAKGLIVIYNDIRTMLADGALFVWEHEGMMDDFFYRCNATERSSVMKLTNTVCAENLLETNERDIDTPAKIINIIEQHVLPRLWF